MSSLNRRLTAACSAVIVSTAALHAQQAPTASGEAVRVFLDCNAPFCDSEHFRREITFVNWMRDRQDADVHLLVTAESTGGGGWEFSLAFIGRRAAQGQVDTLRYTSRNTDTGSEVRDGVTQTIRLGLVRFVARTPVGRRLRITLPEGGEQVDQAQPQDDPWNFWTFDASLSGDIFGEEQFRFRSVRGSFSARRVTESHKMRFHVSGSTSREAFDVPEEDTTFVTTQHRWQSQVTTVWSLGAQWSAGGSALVRASSFQNQDLEVRAGPAIEFNVYPYSESTRRQMVVQYFAGLAAFDYKEQTIFGVTEEVRPVHTFLVATEVVQPWGEVDASLQAAQYLHDLARHSIGVSGGLQLRIVRGLNLRLFGNVARVKDQLNLPQEDLTAAEVLLRRRELGTDYRYNAFLSFNFTFGSKFANVVNPRMTEGPMF